MQIEINGLASGKVAQIEFFESDLDKTLLNFLRTKNITIASSCDGEGICKKCVIQNDWLTCKLTLKAFLQCRPDGKIYISYL